MCVRAVVLCSFHSSTVAEAVLFNPGLALTRPYPFTRLRTLLQGIEAPKELPPISFGLGEPRHPIQPCIPQALTSQLEGLSHYPPTAGPMPLREAIAQWIARRYGVTLDPAACVLPVLGSREALFSLVQTVVDPTHGANVVMPTPFYQIYEGAALMAHATPIYLPITPENGFHMEFERLSEEQKRHTQLVFTCSPGNPTGSVMSLDQWKELFELSDRYGFVIASDECYSEIYFEEGKAPLGALTAAKMLGRGTQNLIILQSLSKRSSAPGLRSGFVAGDPSIMKRFLLYRTYHGSAMSLPVAAASLAAWKDETYPVYNRSLYRDAFVAAQPVIAQSMDAPMPQASFYLWARVPGGDDERYARELYKSQAVTVLPGSYLSRDSFGFNAGRGFVRIALVATPEEVREGAQRLERFTQTYARQFA